MTLSTSNHSESRDQPFMEDTTEFQSDELLANLIIKPQSEKLSNLLQHKNSVSLLGSLYVCWQ